MLVINHRRHDQRHRLLPANLPAEPRIHGYHRSLHRPGHRGEHDRVQPGERALIPTGVCLTNDMPDNYLLAVCSRSGLAINHGIYVLNAPGIIDADFVGQEIQVILANCGSEPVYIAPRLRIAQCVLFEHKGQVGTNETLRLGGFGSTG